MALRYVGSSSGSGLRSEVIERYHSALSEFMTGKAEPAVAFFSQRDDVTLANPFGPVARGPNQVRLASSRLRSM